MIIILSILLGVVAYVGHNQIRKYFVELAVLTTILSIATLFIDLEVTQVITQGFIGLAFFVIVMFAGAFQRKSKISKRLRSVRKEYSILGFILLLPHAYVYTVQFIDGSYPVEWYGVIAFLVMIPLFITSFRKIKKSMGMKKWKEFQKWAYLAYALTFVHLIFVSEDANQISYTIIFGFYTFFKLKNYILVKYSSDPKTVQALILVAVIAVIGYAGYSAVSATSLDGVEYIETELVDGVYTGTAVGFHNLETELEVTVEDGEITEIIMVECGCTAPHHGTDYEEAAYDMIDEILQTQSTDIDSISGATKTTESVLKAVNDALEDE